MARHALALTLQFRLRGTDALYVAAARQYGARLVTLDAAQLERAPAAVRACKPDSAARLLKKPNDIETQGGAGDQGTKRTAAELTAFTPTLLAKAFREER